MSEWHRKSETTQAPIAYHVEIECRVQNYLLSYESQVAVPPPTQFTVWCDGARLRAGIRLLTADQLRNLARGGDKVLPALKKCRGFKTNPRPRSAQQRILGIGRVGGWVWSGGVPWAVGYWPPAGVYMARGSGERWGWAGASRAGAYGMACGKKKTCQRPEKAT